jgi:hypothetical protein
MNVGLSSVYNAKAKAISYRMKELFQHWKSSKEFASAQAQVIVIIFIAWCGNNFPQAYPRNDNHNMFMFWFMNIAFVVAGLITIKHDPEMSSRGVQLLSRPQTEEWKGWMQWAFIMVRVVLDLVHETVLQYALWQITHQP